MAVGGCGKPSPRVMGVRIETDLRKIEAIAKKKEDENWKFREFLKCCDFSSRRIDSVVRRLYRQVSSKIDCKTCANCCKKLLPLLDQEDIDRLSRAMGLTVEQFKERYLVRDEEGGGYTFNRKPCPLLRENSCLYEDYRPKDCVSYPHLHKGDFVSRTITVIQNYSICPIVFNVYELLKKTLWYDWFLDRRWRVK